MIDFFLAVAVLLLALGILGSLQPGLPGPLLSIAGVMLYWWSTGYESPGAFLFIVIVSTGILAVVLDLLASYYGADKGGASKKTIHMALAASVILFLVTGPIGIIIGTAGVILLREIMLGNDFDDALNTALVTTLALLGSAAAKVILTLLMLALFILSILL